MTASIGLSTGANPLAFVKPTTGLEAQIARYKKELSGCVNCESAKTAEGKANIQALSDKISALTTQVQEISQSNSASQENKITSATVSFADQSASKTVQQQHSQSGFEAGEIGALLNVFA